MSASVYNNPYAYKAPPPRINYPPMFAGLRNISFRHILDSKFLALAALLQGVATLVVFITIINPFWFKLILSPTDGTFGSAPVKPKLTLDAGLFYVDESEFDNTAFLNKYTGRDVVPKPLILGQVFSVIGTCMLIICLVGTCILVLRRFGSVTATIILAFFSSVAGLCQILVFICALVVVLKSNCEPGDDCDYRSNLVWRMIPIYTQFYRVEPHLTPYVEPNWAFFISIIGGLLACAGSVLVWIEALVLYRSVTRIRYEQLRRARDPHEKDIHVPRGGFVYEPPVQYGAGSYGMQPVVYTSGPYSGHVTAQPPPGIGFVAPRPGIGFAPPSYSESGSDYQGRPPSPPLKRFPPSESSSVSGGHNISREINL